MRSQRMSATQADTAASPMAGQWPVWAVIDLEHSGSHLITEEK